MTSFPELEVLRWDLRQQALDMVYRGRTGHIGGDFSVVDALMVLYLRRLRVDPARPDDPDRDRFVLSKGHAVEAFYAVLAAKGFLDVEDAIERYAQYESPYIGHPSHAVPGIEMNTGSLGHGLPVAVGMALAAKMDGRGYRTYCFMGDGEQAEGSVWEGAMSGSNFKLDNLCALVDRNHLQISGDTEDVMALDSLAARWEAFGWNVLTVDGHDLRALDDAFDLAERTKGKPTVIIAETVKGYGSDVCAGKAGWHHQVPDDEQYAAISADLTAHKLEAEAELEALRKEAVNG